MNRPAPVEVTYRNMRFLITHNPTNTTLSKFIEELKKYGVTTIVGVCEATYDTTLVEKEGIHVLNVHFNVCTLGCNFQGGPEERMGGGY
uniref:Protein tyrosine phosphatase 4A1 n=1 Tax=Moschus moschiferus TaxID=68415 RepID=A0A8C6E4W2_MOSMO